MGQVATITLTDAESTPVDHSFVPRKVQGDVAYFVDKADSRPMAWLPLTLSHRLPDAGNGSNVIRDRLTLRVPVVETVDGTDVVTRENVIDIEMRTTTATTEQERDNLVTMIADAMSESLVRDMFVSGNNLY